MPTYAINILKPVYICYKIEQSNFYLLAPPRNAPLPQQNHSLWETHFASAESFPHASRNPLSTTISLGTGLYDHPN